jgi:predicted nucleic acid-binding protein
VTGPARGILDTSVFIASESGRPIDQTQLPEESAISVITLAELQVGVLAARDTDTRSRRMATLNAVADVEVLPVDEAVALEWARLRVQLAEAGRRVNVNDLWIAATAAANGLPVITQDADYEPLQTLGEVSVIQV